VKFGWSDKIADDPVLLFLGAMKNAVRGFVFITISFLFSCQPSGSVQEDRDFLAQMRSELGWKPLSEGFDIYAMADCTGPASVFQTLVLSSLENTRFEQKSGPRHSLGVYRPDSAWLYDFVRDTAVEADSATIAFLINHELHATAFYPESRYGQWIAEKDTTYYDDEADMLTFKDIKGGLVRVFYHATTALPLGFRIENHLGRGASFVDVLFDDWQQLQGVRVFTAARFLQGQDVYEYRFTKISFDKLSDQVFMENKPLISP